MQETGEPAKARQKPEKKESARGRIRTAFLQKAGENVRMQPLLASLEGVECTGQDSNLRRH